jgi:rhodanese-related sulfurtransferase
MESKEELIATAAQRAAQLKLPYAGALTPREAFALMQAAPEAKLVDVRTRAEWDFVGRVPGSIQIEWNTYPGGQPNPHFSEQLQVEVTNNDAPLLFLCRSGGRSHNAAARAAQLGYKLAFNILEGFEGDRDANGHRGTVGGWKVARLPWHQG